MASLRTVGTEALALGTVVASIPLRFLMPDDRFDPDAHHPTPVVLVHGLFGDPTNFLFLQRHLSARGIANFASFSYGPRFDYQRLAVQLGHAIDALCQATGAPVVDVVGHSLGGLIGRYLVELAPEGRVRRLVTLGAPYFTPHLPPHELAVFGAADPLIPAPHPIHGPHPSHCRPEGGVVVVPECGHWGLLYHGAAMQAAASYLGVAELVEIAAPPPLALEAAS